MDEVAFDEIKKLSGKRIHISISIINLDFLLCFTPEGFSITDTVNQDVDVVIKATPLNFFRMILQHYDDTGGGNVAKLEITGDVGLAQSFQSILSDLDIDWEEYFSNWIGDYPAHKLGLVLYQLRQYTREARQSFARDISEYLRYEKESIPLIEEVDCFNQEVDDLRNDSDRLRQRIDRLERSIYS